jgi:hypothetical protein
VDAEALRAAVEAQADARVRGDWATSASYMTPQAVVQLGAVRLPPGRARKFRVLDVTSDDAAGSTDVRYEGSWSYVVRTRWQLIDGFWKATGSELVADSLRAPLWRRLIGRTSPPQEPVPPRRDLS